MFKYFFPRQDDFFSLFNRHAKEMKASADGLHVLFSNLENVSVQVKNIEHAEKRADEVTHETIDLLHQTFITPFDREQICLLITKMDDVVDLIEDAAQTIYLYNVQKLTPETKKLESIILHSVVKIEKVVALLSNMKNAEAIMALTKEIKDLEGEADYVMREGVAKLFREKHDAYELIKMKEVYELLETVTDRCDDVADIVKGVVLENG